MRNSSRKKYISGLSALLLLAVFALGILSVLLSGAGAYRRLTERAGLAFDSRSCAQYVATVLRQAPSPGAVSLVRFGDGDALLISEETEGQEYRKSIYCHDGWLMELFTGAEGNFAPEDGEKLLPLQSLELRRSDTLLYVDIVDSEGGELSLVLVLPGEEVER